MKFGKGIGKPYDTDAMLSRDEFCVAEPKRCTIPVLVSFQSMAT